MIAWVDRATYMERLWALEDAQSRLFIDEVQLREGFEMASDSIRARGGWDICLTEFELEMREEPEERLWLTANWRQVRDGWRTWRARGRHSGRAEVPGVPENLARLLAEEKEEGTEDSDRKVKEDWGDVDEEAW